MAKGVKHYWGSMLHPPLSYRGDAFQYRSADGADNSIPTASFTLSWVKRVCLTRSPFPAGQVSMELALTREICSIVGPAYAILYCG